VPQPRSDELPISRPLRIGWKEYLDFPEWQLRRVRVKIDTGARTSALGAISYDLVEDEQQGLRVRMRLALHRRRPERVVQIEVPVLRMVTVKNTGGSAECRPLIETLIRLGPITRRIRLTVTSRHGLRFAMILGREALAGDFVVDVSAKYLLRSK
jgi:hypothetical protein